VPRRAEWRDLPKRFGNRHNLYAHMNRWSKSGVMVRVLEELQQSQVVRIKIEAVSPDSTSVKGHPDGTGAKKNARKPSEKSRGGWNTKIHMVAA
jgi:hypothetical protein